MRKACVFGAEQSLIKFSKNHEYYKTVTGFNNNKNKQQKQQHGRKKLIQLLVLLSHMHSN